jgi:hypothetical protein
MAIRLTQQLKSLPKAPHIVVLFRNSSSAYDMLLSTVLGTYVDTACIAYDGSRDYPGNNLIYSCKGYEYRCDRMHEYFDSSYDYGYDFQAVRVDGSVMLDFAHYMTNAVVKKIPVESRVSPLVMINPNSNMLKTFVTEPEKGDYPKKAFMSQMITLGLRNSLIESPLCNDLKDICSVTMSPRHLFDIMIPHCNVVILNEDF